MGWHLDTLILEGMAGWLIKICGCWSILSQGLQWCWPFSPCCLSCTLSLCVCHVWSWCLVGFLKIPGQFCVATVGGNQDGSVGKIFSGNHGAQAWVFWITWRHSPLCSTDVTGIQLPEYPEGKRCRAKMLFWKDVSRKSLWLNLVICHSFQNMLGPFQGQSIGGVAWLGQIGNSWGTWIWSIPRKLAWLRVTILSLLFQNACLYH